MFNIKVAIHSFLLDHYCSKIKYIYYSDKKTTQRKGSSTTVSVFLSLPHGSGLVARMLCVRHTFRTL
nr:hypothetical protein [Mucilaginibacter sp. FT3.2]